MTINEIVAPGSSLLSVGTNVVLFMHLSSVMNSGFDNIHRKFGSVERRLEVIQTGLSAKDTRLTSMDGK